MTIYDSNNGLLSLCYGIRPSGIYCDLLLTEISHLQFKVLYFCIKMM